MTENPTLHTLDRMEPMIATVIDPICLASIAISMKRIADALERCTSPHGLFALVDQVNKLVDAAEKK